MTDNDKPMLGGASSSITAEQWRAAAQASLQAKQLLDEAVAVLRPLAEQLLRLE